MDGLPFHHVIALDFEFSAPDGELPEVVCMVVRDLRTGQEWSLFQNELAALRAPPFPTGDDAVIVAYYASAEMLCFQMLEWALPTLVLDLFTEFRCKTNGLPAGMGGASLIGALAWHGLSSIEAVEKDAMRALAIRGGPYTDTERIALLDYCRSDVDALARLLLAMLPELDVPRALLRGRYMKAAAAIEFNGIPIDTRRLALLQQRWEAIQDRLIAEVDKNFGVYDGRRFKVERFAEYLIRQDIAWPRLASGGLELKEDTFKDMARAHPQLTPLRELRISLSKLRLSGLAVGSDGRNRCMLSAFRARTGRNQPSNTRFIFGPSTWIRSLIRPPPGVGLAYIDWSQQEFGIAAALSGDITMLEAYRSGDPYLAFAKQAGAVPAAATKETHPNEREQFKACVLAVQYGMGEASLAVRINQPVMRARQLLEMHRRTYATFWAWSDAALDCAMVHGALWTVFGWRIQTDSNPNPRSLRNFPMQANGAEMLRLACCLAVERGIRVCAPVHDAVLIEASLTELEDAVEATKDCMAQASRIVLGGFELGTEVALVRHPERYRDKRGQKMWRAVWDIIDGMEPVEAAGDNLG